MLGLLDLHLASVKTRLQSVYFPSSLLAQLCVVLGGWEWRREGCSFCFVFSLLESLSNSSCLSRKTLHAFISHGLPGFNLVIDVSVMGVVFSWDAQWQSLLTGRAICPEGFQFVSAFRPCLDGHFATKWPIFNEETEISSLSSFAIWLLQSTEHLYWGYHLGGFQSQEEGDGVLFWRFDLQETFLQIGCQMS